MSGRSKLSDDWLWWDPRRVEEFPHLHAQAGVAAHEDEAEPPRPHACSGLVRRLLIEVLHYLAVGTLAGLAAAAVLAATVLVLPAARAAGGAEDGAAGPSEATRGSLLLRADDEAEYRHAPLLETAVRIQVTALLARVRVEQRFIHRGNGWVEGVYVFPLPETAAVDRLRMRVGGRLVEGHIHERAEAKRIYSAAKRSGRKAALLAQQRPNIFTNAVANIGPGEEVMVEIEYQQDVRYDGGAMSLRFPLVVGPRYVPGTPLPTPQRFGAFSEHGWAADTDRVPDASRITPPVRDPDSGLANRVRIQVDIDAGFPIEHVRSPYHATVVARSGDSGASVRLAGEPVPADRDFLLEWKPRAGTQPQAALFREQIAGQTYLLAMVLAPELGRKTLLDRETTIVIDTSGSMGGASIRQARDAVSFALSKLKPRDYFNVIQFNSVTDALFEHARPASGENLARAARYVAALQARGGTEMRPALRRALAGGERTAAVRQVIFVTDGAVGNEAELFGLIRSELGDRRLFTVGIGSAPNSHFMRKAAEFGRGTFTYIGRPEEVAERMESLFEKLERPVLADISAAWPESAGLDESWPVRLPDLYQGEPIILSARVERASGELLLRGDRAGARWEARLSLDGASTRPGVGVLWARRKIDALTDSLHDGADAELVRAGVIEVALEHHLVSRHTSLVAVDVTPTRVPGAPISTRAVPTNLPAGWDYRKVFGALPQTATDAPLHALMGLAALALAGVLRRAARARR